MKKKIPFNIKSFVSGVILLLILVLWFTFRVQIRQYLFSANGLDVSSREQTGVTLISSQEFSDLIADKNVFVLDVHTPEQTHIPGTDAFIPFDQIAENVGKLPSDKSTPIAVYCRSGSMSSRVAKELVEMGYTSVYDLEGGTNAYKEQQVSVSLLPEKQDLGTVIYGDVARTTLTFTNYMPMPIKITRVSTSCGCTKAVAQNTEIGPYESTIIDVSFDPAVHKDDTDLGELTRTIYVETDRDDFSELQAMFSANVVKK